MNVFDVIGYSQVPIFFCVAEMQRITHHSTHCAPSPVQGPETAGPLSMPPYYLPADAFLARAHIPAGHGSRQDTAHFVRYPFHTPTTTASHLPSLLLKDPWIANRIMVLLACTFTHSPEIPQSCPLYGIQGNQQHGLPSQFTIQAASNLTVLRISKVTHPSGIPVRFSSCGMLRPPQELQSAIPGAHPRGSARLHPRGFQRGSQSGGEYVQNGDSPSDKPHPSE